MRHYAGKVENVKLRGNAAFATPELYALCEELGIDYAVRIKERRIVTKTEHHQGELFPRIGYIVTSLQGNKKSVVKFYNRRGTCEQWIKEGKYALNWTRLSCHEFRENEVRLNLLIMAYNLGNIFRTLALPETIKSWSLRTIQLKLIKWGRHFQKRQQKREKRGFGCG